MKDILSIDGEPFVLNSLKRLTRKERNRWEAHFAVGGKEALNLLERRSSDLVATDIKTPIIDGIQDFATCQNLHPSMPRIALPGYSEKETQARVTRPPHDFLHKPCDSEALESALGNRLED